MKNSSDEWLTQPIFVSSTFKDLQAERDYLRDFVFPAVEEELLDIRCHTEFIDLRWGLDTYSYANQEAKELQVLKVCLNEIKRSHPFLIVILGDRYGWVPPMRRLEAAVHEEGLNISIEEKSITALEIEFGALQNKLGNNRTFFYFREMDYSEVPPDLRVDYSDELSLEPDAQVAYRQLKALKKRIRESIPENRIRTFRPVWDKVENRVTGFELWGEQVRKDLTESIHQEIISIKSTSNIDVQWWQKEEICISEFIESKMRTMINRKLVDELMEFSISDASSSVPWATIVSGVAGSGKSCIWAALSRQLQNQNCIMLVNAAGISSKAGNISAMLARWIQNLSFYSNENITVPLLDETAPLEKLEEKFAQMLTIVSEKRRVVCLVDALDQFETTLANQNISWIPRRWPANARLVVTILSGTLGLALKNRQGVINREMQPLNQSEAEAVLYSSAKLYHKVLHIGIVETLLEKQTASGNPAFSNPLWLSIAVEDLLLLDQDDFAEAQRFSGSAEQQLHQFILERIHNMPSSLSELYIDLLERARKLGMKIFGVKGSHWVDIVLDLLASSRYGLREFDLKNLTTDITGIVWNPLTFAHLRRYLRAHLAEMGDNRLWNFAHRELRAALTQLRLSDKNYRKNLHKKIGEHLFQQSSDDSLRAKETMFHLLESDLLEKAREFFSLPDSSDSARGVAALRLLQKYKGHELSEVALESASISLADLQIKDSLIDVSIRTGWLEKMFSEAVKDQQEGFGLGRLVHRLVNDVLPALRDRSGIGEQIEYLSSLRKLIQGIVPNVPEEVKDDAQKLERILGELHRKSELRNHAVLYFERALFVAEMNYRAVPNSLASLIEALTSLGDLYLKNNPAEATYFYERSNELYETDACSQNGSLKIIDYLDEFSMLYGGVPKQMEDMARTFQLNFRARHMCRMGNICLFTKKYDEAFAWFERADSLSRKQSDQVDFNPEFAETLVQAGIGMAEVEWNTGRQKNALARYIQLADLSTLLMRKSPARILFLSFWSKVCLLISEGKYWFGEFKEGSNWLEDGMASVQEILDRLPDDVELIQNLLTVTERIIASSQPDKFPSYIQLNMNEMKRLVMDRQSRIRAAVISDEKVMRELSQIRQVNFEQGLLVAAERIDRIFSITGSQCISSLSNDPEKQALQFFEMAHNPNLSFQESKELLRKCRDILKELQSSGILLDPALIKRLSYLELLFMGE